MKLLAYFRSVIAKFFHRSQVEDEMAEELRSHIEYRADDLERSGLKRAEAVRRARIEFGGDERYKEECREELGGNFIETVGQDARFSLRMLRKSPGFTLTAVFTLALGIGANAVVFSVMNGFLLRPLNVPQAENLYMIERSEKGTNHSYPDYRDLRDRNRSFDDLAASDITLVGLDTGQVQSRSWIFTVSGNYFDALRLQPSLGRFFHASDEHGPNSAPYIVLSYAYWHTHFQDDHGVIGRTVQLNKHPFTIIGVAPPDFIGTILFFSPDFYVSMINEQQIYGEGHLEARGNRWVSMVMGHLKAGVTPAQAVADLNSVGAYLEATYPKDDAKMTYQLARPGFGGDDNRVALQAFLVGLMLLAGLILLAACANLGSLFAARAADRAREVALRLALGAGRLRVLRQLFTEAIMLSLMGGAIGLWGSIALLRALSGWQPLPRYPVHMSVAPDFNVYAVALLLTIASGFLFGSVPVRQILRTNPYEVVKLGPTGNVGRKMTVRDALLVVQIAICALLVTASIVAVRGLIRSLHSNFGFEPANAILVDTDLGLAGYVGDKAPAMQKRMIDAVASIPGVQHVGLMDLPPLRDCCSASSVFTDQTANLTPGNAAAEAIRYKISPEYLHAAGTALLSGRPFTWHDDKNAPRVAIVNREFAGKVFGSATNAIGEYYKMPDGMRIQVVGVVADGKYNTITEDQQPAMFLPILQWPSDQAWLVVRSSRDPLQLAPAIRTSLHDLDAGLIFYIETWNKGLDDPLFFSRMTTISLGVMGMIGAILSITGIFGMASYSISKRLKELGIRIALGARRRELLRAALGKPFKLLAIGSAAGLVLGLLTSKLLASIVYSATPRDPLVLTGVVLVMLLLGILATLIPARRALSVDPLILLREE